MLRSDIPVSLIGIGDSFRLSSTEWLKALSAASLHWWNMKDIPCIWLIEGVFALCPDLPLARHPVYLRSLPLQLSPPFDCVPFFVLLTTLSTNTYKCLIQWLQVFGPNGLEKLLEITYIENGKLARIFFRLKFCQGRSRGMPVPKCLPFFPGFGGPDWSFRPAVRRGIRPQTSSLSWFSVPDYTQDRQKADRFLQRHVRRIPTWHVVRVWSQAPVPCPSLIWWIHWSTSGSGNTPLVDQ